MTGRKDDRRGMALLTVLLLVAAVAVLAAAVLDDVRFSIRRASNAESAAQARWLALGVEDLARLQVRSLRRDDGRTPVAPAWNGRPLAFPLDDGGAVEAALYDGQACFNLNSVVDGADRILIRRERGTAQFAALARALGASDAQARRAAAALTDWMDSDNRPLSDGAEDPAYATLASPRRTAGALMAEPGELRAVLGVSAALHDRLEPFICALPETGPSRINPNTLDERDWPLLVMLADGVLTPERARAAIRARPAGGWESVNAFWTQPVLAGLDVAPDVHDQMTLRTRYFVLRATVRHDRAEVARTSLLHDADDRVRVVSGRWTAK